MQNFDGRGYFWLPEHEENRVAGQLTYSQEEGATLELIGSFSSRPADILGVPSDISPKRIVGVAGSTEVTLDQCLLGNTNVSGHLNVLTTFRPQLVIEGAHFETDEPLEFYAVSTHLTHLQTWTHHVGTKLQWPSQGPLTEFHVQYSQPTDEVVDGAFGRMTLGATWRLSGDHVEQTNIAYDCYMKIEPGESRALFDELLPLCNRLQNLVTLALDTVVYPTKISLWHRDITTTTPEGGTRAKPLELWYQRAGDARTSARPPIPSRMLFTYDQLGGLDGVYRWLELSDDYRATLGTLLANRYRPGAYAENRFLNAVVAAEAFDRKKFKNRIEPKQQFRQTRDEILGYVPEERRQWLRDRLQYSNEPRLRFRLGRTARYAGTPFLNLVGDVEAWAKAITDSRNDIAHGRTPLAPSGETGSYLHWLSESIATMIVLCMLRECQADDALIHVLDNDRIKHAGARLRETLNV